MYVWYFPKGMHQYLNSTEKLKIEVWNIDRYHVAFISFVIIKLLCNLKQISKPSLVQDTLL